MKAVVLCVSDSALPVATDSGDSATVGRLLATSMVCRPTPPPIRHRVPKTEYHGHALFAVEAVVSLAKARRDGCLAMMRLDHAAGAALRYVAKDLNVVATRRALRASGSIARSARFREGETWLLALEVLLQSGTVQDQWCSFQGYVETLEHASTA